VATKNPRNKNYRYKCGDFLIAGEENAPLVGLITDIVGAKEVEVLVYTGSGKRWKRTSDFKVIHTENVVVAVTIVKKYPKSIIKSHNIRG